MKKNMKRIITLILTLALTLNMLPLSASAEETSGQNAGQTDVVLEEGTPQGQQDDPQGEPKGAQPAERTILLYDCGADLETLGAMATYNLHQILRASFSKDEKVRFIVMTGGSAEWHMEKELLFDPATGQNMDAIPTEYNQIWEAKGADAEDHPGQMVLLDGDGILGDGENAKKARAVRDFDENGDYVLTEGTPEDYEWMTDPGTLKAFINYGVANFPAEKYDLILWDHGGGPTGGFGVDQNAGNDISMSMLEVIDALRDNDLVKNGGKFDFVDFDACLMSSVEYVYGLADCMDYYIASPETEPGNGQDYEGWLNALGESPDMDTFALGKKIVDDYISFYDKEEGDGAGRDGTLAVYDIAKLLSGKPGESSLLDELTTLNGLLRQELEAGNYYDEGRAISQVMHYGDMNFVDLGQLVSQLGYTFWEADKDNLTGDNNIDMNNAYTEVARHIQLILQDQEVVYSRGTKNMQTDPSFYNGINGFAYGSQGTSGIYLFMPSFDDTYQADYYLEWMDQFIGLFPEGDQRAAFFRDYRGTVSELMAIHIFAKEIATRLEEGTPKDEITYDAIKSSLQEMHYGEEPSIWDILVLPYIDWAGGEEAASPWLKNVVSKLAQASVVRSNISSEPIETEQGIGHRITIKDADKQVVDSVSYSISADLPAIDAFLNRPGNEELKEVYEWMPERLTLGNLGGKLETGFEENDYGKAVEWLADKNSVWNIDPLEEKWYALKDSEGNLHVAAPDTLESDYAIIPAVYESTEFVWDDRDNTYTATPKLNLILLAFDDGYSRLAEIGFIKEDGRMRAIEASQFRGNLEITTCMAYYLLGISRLELPISETSFTLSPETIDNLSLEYTDIKNISDIRDTDGDGKALSVHASVRNIFGGYLDISDLVFDYDVKSIQYAQVTGIENRTYTGKAITQKPVVQIGNKILTEGQDYVVSYVNNTKVGTATMTITGKGHYVHSVTKTFEIGKVASSISIPTKKTVYNKKAVNYKTSEATVKGSTGKVTFAYYSDAKCTKAVKAANVKNAGTYYVKASVAADANYNKATSSAAKLTISQAKNTFAIKAAKRSAKAGKTIAGIKVTKKGTGAKTYKIKSVNKKKYAKKFKINKKTGKIKINKKTPKGKYVVTVSVKAAKTKNYKASAWKKAKVTITVK